MQKTLTEIYDEQVAKGTLKADPAQADVLMQLEPLREWLQQNPVRKTGLFAGLFARPVAAPRGFYIWGGVGRGKSMLMDLFVHHTDIVAKRRVHFHAFMQEVHHALHLARQGESDDPLRLVVRDMVRGLRLLALDEMQITDITDAMLVGRLFQLLTEKGVAVITTSNRPPRDLYLNGLNRDLFVPFISFLEEHLHVVALDSDHDYRQNRLNGAQVYFYPLGRAGPQIDALWQDLTRGQAAQRLDLVVDGRHVELPCFVAGMARVSFWDLCGKPLGPADYLCIAQSVRLLVMENIPQLSAANYNEAKRFVTLIDALYEGKVRLICSAADMPERLYLEGEGAFEFERTASRLREMQDACWGQ